MKAKDSASLKAISGVSKVPCYSPAAVKKLMARLKLNERGFAMLMNTSPATVRMWLDGEAKPCGLSRRLMQIYDYAPGVIEQIVKSKDTAYC
jgi:DNA-binding transcriptional regulator YiaG